MIRLYNELIIPPTTYIYIFYLFSITFSFFKKILQLQDGYSSMVWSTTPNLATKIKSMSSKDFVYLVNAAFQMRIADLEYFYSQLGNSESVDFQSEFEWRKSVQLKNSGHKEEFPPLVLG